MSNVHSTLQQVNGHAAAEQMWVQASFDMGRLLNGAKRPVFVALLRSNFQCLGFAMLVVVALVYAGCVGRVEMSEKQEPSLKSFFNGPGDFSAD